MVSVSVMPLTACGSVKKETASFSIDPEKTLVVYTSHKTEVYTPIIREFEKRTGITVEVHDGGTIEMLDEIKEGNSADVMFGGGVETYLGYQDSIEPYFADGYEMVSSKYISKEGYYTLFSDLPLVFVYNRKLVKEEDAPKTWNDLFSSKWTAKIAFADPHNSGTSVTILLAMMSILNGGSTNVIRKFSEQLNGEFVGTSGNVLPAVESGASSIGITLEETAKKWMLTHQDVGIIYPEDGTFSIPDGSFLVKNCAHPENAKKFIDFTISTDVQKLLVDEMYRRSVRTDIPFAEDEEKIKYIDFDLNWAAKEQEEVLKVWENSNP
jgi:ABC-type Fe3+ transport system, periplasmic component